MNPEVLTAKKWYRWLWLSPFVTLLTLAIGLLSLDISIVIALLISAFWHLVVLIPSLNKQSDFIRWHGRQALMLAAIRTVVPISLVVLLGDMSGLMWSIPFLVIVWYFGTRWGEKQAERGECSLANWLGREISLPPPELELVLEGDEDPDVLVEIVRFSHDPQERRTALLKLDKLGMIEGLDQISAIIPGGPPVESQVSIPAARKDRSYVWFILLGAAIVLTAGLGTINRRQEAKSATATAQARATAEVVAALNATATIQALEAIPRSASAYPVVLYDTFDADEDVWWVGDEDSEHLTGAKMIDGSAYRWEATAKKNSPARSLLRSGRKE